MIAETIAEALGGKPDSNGWICHCPAHDDKHPSLSVSEGKVMPLVHCFAGCSQEEVIAVLKAMGLWEGGPLSPQTALQPCNLENYSTKKGLPIDFLKKLGLSDLTYQGSPAIKIPYRDLSGEEVAANFRLFLDKGMGEDVRFKWKSGTKKLLYGLWRLGKSDHVVLVEGESDCHTLWYHDIPAIGLPGAGCWNDSRDGEYFDGIQSIYIVIEPDQGGESVKKWVAKSAIKDRVKLVTLPNKDPSGLYVNDPGSFIKSFSNALEKAQPYSEYERLGLDAEHKEAWEQCQELAKERKILDHFIKDFRQVGVVGEDRAGKLIYLAVTSRFLSRPVSIVLKGPSSGGKSYVTEQVLRFFPEQAYYSLTGMSEKALAYSEEPLQNRFIVICEASGLENDFASYLMRSLLSEGRLAYETVEKTADGIKAKLIEREGPTGLIVTTTKVKLHPENETRLLSIPIKDTQDQTKAVLMALAEDRVKEIDLSKWQALQTWLYRAEHEVTIPFANKLAELIPPVAVRLRRDFMVILNLIKSHALLHQVNRQRDSQGRIVAEMEDYAVIRDLVSELVSEGVEATVPQTVGETVAAVDSLADENGVSIAQVARKLSLDKSSASRRVWAALDRGFLKNLETEKNRYRLVLGDSLPEDRPILPEPERLQGCKGDRIDTHPPSPKDRFVTPNTAGNGLDKEMREFLAEICGESPNYVTPERVMEQLNPNDYLFLLNDPEYARGYIKTLSERLAP